MTITSSTRWTSLNNRIVPIIRLETFFNGRTIAVHFTRGSSFAISEAGRYIDDKPHRYGVKEVDKRIDALVNLKKIKAIELSEWLEALAAMSNGQDKTCYKIINRAEASMRGMEVSL